MKIGELIKNLIKIKEENGDIDVVIITDGEVYKDIDFNYPDSDSPLYIEGYKE